MHHRAPSSQVSARVWQAPQFVIWRCSPAVSGTAVGASPSTHRCAQRRRARDDGRHLERHLALVVIQRVAVRRAPLPRRRLLRCSWRCPLRRRIVRAIFASFCSEALAVRVSDHCHPSCRLGNTSATSAVDLYDANTNTWKRVDDLTEPRAFLVGAAAGSLIVFAGGYKYVCAANHTFNLSVTARLHTSPRWTSTTAPASVLRDLL